MDKTKTPANPQDIMAIAKAMIELNLVQACTEHVHLKQTGVLPPGCIIRAVQQELVKISATSSLSLALAMVTNAACERVAHRG